MIVFLKKGDCFWYKIKGKIYGVIVLETQMCSDNSPEFLILISEALSSIPVSIDELLEKKSYTAAWFDRLSILAPTRMHYLGHIEIPICFINQYGLKCENDLYSCTNVGQSATWKHEFQSLSFHGETLSDVLSRKPLN